MADGNHPQQGTIIGVPYAGTHAVAFNKAGGSDNWQSENAVDIWLHQGTAILAVCDGTVSPGGWGYGQSARGGRFAGWRLHLVAKPGQLPTVSFYTHLRELVVAKGAKVHKGDVLGYSGIANGVPHLHFAVEPPDDPRAYASLTYTLNPGRRKAYGPGLGKLTGSIANTGHNPPQKVEDAWHNLMRQLHFGWADATAHVKASRDRIHDAVN